MDSEQTVDTGAQLDATPIEQQQPETGSTTETSNAASETTAEKMFTQSQLQAIAAKEARKAEERAEARIRAQYEAKFAQQQAPQPTNLGGNQQLSQHDLQQLIRREAFNMSQEHQARQIEQNWLSAMDAERDADPEFAGLYDALGIEAQPGLVIAMSGMENKAKVVKDLAKNPSKYANILTLANGGSPKLAEIELKKLSASIKANEEAKTRPKADAPLSQIRGSNITGDDGNYSNMSTTDFRNQPWLRG